MTSSPAPDWYLKDWLAHFGKKQGSLTTELEWTKNKTNKLWHGRQPYRRDQVNEVAAWLGIEPYELLMPPSTAVALRKLRETARLIAADHIVVQTPTG